MADRIVRTGLLALALVVPVAIACSDDPTAPSSGIRVVAGGGITDTILAAPTQALVVEVAGAAESTVVRFSSVLVTVPCPYAPEFECSTPTVLIGHPDRIGYDVFIGREVDGRRRATVTLRFGTLAGPGGVVVSVPELGLTDTVRYTILPGEPAEIRTAPGDAYLVVGESDSISASVLDRGGNPLDRAVELTALTPAIASIANARVRGEATGVGRVRLSAGALVDTAEVVVLPDARITVVTDAPPYRILELRLDGEDTLVVAQLGHPNAGPTRDPLLERWLHFRPEGASWGLYEVSPDGASEPAFAAPFQWAAWPAFSEDGQHIWFEARTGSDGCIGAWRVGRDGSGVDSVLAIPDYSLRVPRAAPDGSRFAALRGSCDGWDAQSPIHIYDADGGGLVEIEGAHLGMAWSPDSDELAVARYGETFVYSIPDGALLRGPFVGPWDFGGIDWSPDGQWLVVHSWPGIVVVDATTGAELPTPLGGREPEWR